MTDKFMSLSHMKQGDKGKVYRLNGGRALNDRLLVMGFTKGAEISVKQNPGFGPVIVYVRDARIALGRGEANKVIVEKLLV
jgi:ferrous iron transport protein A